MDDSRKYGDVAIVKSKYGYHIMYFIDKCPQYQYNCKKDILSNRETQMVDGCAVKEHKTVMKKATQLSRRRPPLPAALLPPAPPANNSKTKREQALSPENACFLYILLKKTKNPCNILASSVKYLCIVFSKF